VKNNMSRRESHRHSFLVEASIQNARRHKNTRRETGLLLFRMTHGIGRQAWIAAALYGDLRGEWDKALTFIDKALQLAPQHVLCHHVRGAVLLSLQRPDHAVGAFRQVRRAYDERSSHHHGESWGVRRDTS
jgi:tetratricopeptide (TPR) repeat protein